MQHFIKVHEYAVRVYVEDVDCMGIVYHPNYLCYLERARTELLRDNNWILSDLIKKNILFAIKELTIKYIFPARLDDLLKVVTQITEQSVCSFMFDQSIINQDGTLICEAQILVVCVNCNLKPQRLPLYSNETNE